MARKVCHKFLELIQKKAMEVPTSEYGEKLIQRKDFYDRVERMLIYQK